MNYNEADAQDVLQECWMVAIRKLDSFRGDSTFKTWITSILINKCREKVRERMQHNGQTLETDLARSLSTEMTTDRIDLQRALAGLAPGYRQVLVLHDVEGFKHEEIASMLGVAAGTSKSQLHEARKAVRDFLMERPNERR
jgi:RNA polymerase sigma-70 factor (ECF subfamily)